MSDLPETPSSIQTSLLSKINEWQALRAIQRQGPMSRAEVARYAHITAPTASKTVESLLKAGLLEEEESGEVLRGRPARKLRLTNKNAQVLGLALDADKCRVVSAGLDGVLHDEIYEFRTPGTYPILLDTAGAYLDGVLKRGKVTTLGLGISIPGLVDYTSQRSILSPNLPITNSHSPVQYFAKRLGIECVQLQESHALCLAERHYGNAIGMDDFAMLDVNIGVGLGVMSGGRLLKGNRGLAGEIGHITVCPEGRRCGCGNTGCLETEASDSALVYAISQRLGRAVDIDEVVQLIQSGTLDPRSELERVCRYLAIGVASVINLFNPSTLFIHGRMFAADPELFSHLLIEIKKRALAPSFADCTVVLARGSKRQGAIAGIVEHLFNSLLPPSMQASTSWAFPMPAATTKR
ncbi:N-acetylglucosamine repressor [Armatimonadota bacterium]|nr:N-acetylglucosamine repressor [Armatimonadota bacterium]